MHRFEFKTSLDEKKMRELLEQSSFTKHLSAGLDRETLVSAQKTNLDALVEANKAVAAGYQDLFKKQIAIFEETMAEAQQQLSAFGEARVEPERTKVQAELAKEAFERALTSMQDLAVSAQRANVEAYEAVAARVRKSIVEFRNTSDRLAGQRSFQEPMPAGRVNKPTPESEKLELPAHLAETWVQQAPRRNLAAEFRRMRRQTGLSQAAVAERMGVSQPVVARMESAVGPWPRKEAIAAFARACGKDAVIVFREEPRPGEPDAGVVRL